MIFILKMKGNQKIFFFILHLDEPNFLAGTRLILIVPFLKFLINFFHHYISFLGGDFLFVWSLLKLKNNLKVE